MKPHIRKFLVVAALVVVGILAFIGAGAVVFVIALSQAQWG